MNLCSPSRQDHCDHLPATPSRARYRGASQFHEQAVPGRSYALLAPWRLLCSCPSPRFQDHLGGWRVFPRCQRSWHKLVSLPMNCILSAYLHINIIRSDTLPDTVVKDDASDKLSGFHCFCDNCMHMCLLLESIITCEVSGCRGLSDA